jgi:RHS repeat-associated protein
LRARLLATIGGTRNYINGISYKPSQQVQSIQLANGLTESYGYSADRLQLTSQSVQQGQNQPLMNIGYNYNADQTSGGGTKAGNSGQLISMTAAINNVETDNNRDQSFKYDQVGRLTYASGSQETGAWQRRYTYDRWGNRKKVETFSSSSGGWCTKQVVDFKYAANGSPLSNRPTSVEDYTNCNPGFKSPPWFDAAGNTTSFGTWNGVTTHFYDGESRLVEVRNISGQSVGQYTYDASNRRVKKVTASGTVHYVWEGSRVVAEYDGTTGAVLTEYVYAGGRMLAQETSGKVTYYHQDRLSVRLLTDTAGKVVAQMSHEPFGEKLLEREEVNKWRFTTYERDAETGSDYAVNRQYAMNIGRFLRPDPVAGSIADPQSMNRYAYVANDPVNLVDPEGLLIISPSIIQSISDWFNNIISISADYSIYPGGWGFGGGGSLGGGIGPGDGGSGGGAGGGGPQKTSPDKYIPDKYKKQFNAALTEAEKRLIKEKCAKLFGKTAEDLIAMLQNTEYRFFPLPSGGPKYDSATDTSSVTGDKPIHQRQFSSTRKAHS